MSRSRAADDTDIISKRLAEMREEQTRQLNCRCRPSDDGGRIETAGCPVHAPDPGSLGLYWPPSDRLSDDWETLREQVRRQQDLAAIKSLSTPISRVLP